jgi:hypothetical protein
MRILHLDILKTGLSDISPAFGALFAEAAAVCLTFSGHKSGVRLKIEGDFVEEYQLEWTQEIGQLEKTSWADMKEAVEYGATALALLLVNELTDFDSFKREDQFQGTDFELSQSKKVNPTIENAKLEISGILTETTENTLNIRVKLKERKIKKRGNLNQLVYVIVVEFGTPKAKIVKI